MGVQRRVEKALAARPAIVSTLRAAKRRADVILLSAGRLSRVPVSGLQAQLRRLGRRAGARAAPPSGRRVLVSLGYQDRKPLTYQVSLALRMVARGDDVRFLRCDRFLFGSEACNVATPPGLDKWSCLRCMHGAAGVLEAAGLRSQGMGEFAAPGDEAMAEARTKELSPSACAAFRHRGIPLGKLARPQLVRYLNADSIPADDVTTALYRRYLAMGVRLAEAFARALDAIRPDAVLMANGIYLADAVMMHVARARGLEVTGWDDGYRPGTRIFTRNKPTDLDDTYAWAKWQDVPLTASENATLDALLAERRAGRGQLHRYYEPERTTKEGLLPSLGLLNGKPTAVLFTNLAFDTAIFERDIVYPGYLDWVEDTIRLFGDHPEWQLAIRNHPAEKFFNVPVERRVEARVRQRVAKLPSNVCIIGSEQTVDSYALMEAADVGVIANSTTGMEMAMLGKPVITVASAHFRGKGFTADPGTPAEYWKAIADAFTRPPDPRATIEAARRFFYFLLYRLSVPVDLLVDAISGDAPRLTPAGEGAILDGNATLDRLAASVFGAPDFVADPPVGAERDRS